MDSAAYDIIVIGAGPAGANFARLIDTTRYRVAVLDGSPAQGKVCGGLISPDAQTVLARYDICLPREVLSAPQLFSVRTVDLGAGQVRHYRRGYLNVDRAAFDAHLRARIPAAVDILKDRCRSITREANGFCLQLASGKRLHCRYLVGAEGAASLTRKTLFPDRTLTRYLAIQQWFVSPDGNPYYSCVFDNATSPACSWIFFKDGQMIYGGAFPILGGRAAFEAQKQKLIEGGYVAPHAFADPIRTEACLLCRPRLTRGIYLGADGAFLLGEAAGLISPSSFEGISYALSSGEALADAFRQVADTEGCARKILRRYARATAPLRRKLALRCIKAAILYNRHLRAAIMKSGIAAIDK